MSEIKSTLDLVMERTRNLTLSADEKTHQEIENARKGFNGAVQKYLDQQLNLEQLRRELAELQKKYPAAGRGDLSEVLLEKIEPDTADSPPADLLQVLFGYEVDGIRRIGQAYRKQLREDALKRTQAVKQMLADDFKIAGTAVRPNLDADPQWQVQVRELKGVFGDKLAHEKKRFENYR